MIRAYQRQSILAMEAQAFETQNKDALTLMLEVGQLLFEAVTKTVSKNDEIVIVCGFGNNGGDGLALHELLIKHQYQSRLYLLASPTYSHENQSMQTIIKKQGIAFELVSHVDDNHLKNVDVIVDAVFGIGLDRDVDVPTQELFETLNRSHAKIISVDVASGLNANTGFKYSACIKADVTYVVGAFKLGQFLFDGLDVSGQLQLLDVGFKDDGKGFKFIKGDQLSYGRESRLKNVHKYHYKHVLVVGGSPSMMGAVALSATAALYGGAGLVSLATLVHHHAYLRNLPYEIMTLYYEDETELKSIVANKDVVAFGMGRSKDMRGFDELRVLLASDKALIVDGDGLSHLAQTKLHPRTQPLILTPHLKELSDLLDVDVKTIKQDIIKHVQAAHDRYQATIILKGPTSIVAHQNKIILYQIGNSALATAGTGDVFAGLLASQLAYDRDVMQAIETTLALYHQSALLIKQSHGEHGAIASDVLTAIRQVMVSM